MLAPHLMVATRNVSSLSRLNRHKSGFIPTEEANAEGLLLLDHKLKPLYFSAKARQICLQINSQWQPGFLDHEDREFLIPESITDDCSNLLELLKLEEHPILWPKERVVVTQNNHKFHLECSLIWKTELAGSQPNFMVVLNEIKKDPDSDTGLLAKFKLSKRELDIIYYINQGLSYEDMGKKLYISKLTVHTHIKNIYRKLGAKSRIELYRYVQPPSWLK
jgi:DNA-binding CsgD family transcriptional regulator